MRCTLGMFTYQLTFLQKESTVHHHPGYPKLMDSEIDTIPIVQLIKIRVTCYVWSTSFTLTNTEGIRTLLQTDDCLTASCIILDDTFSCGQKNTQHFQVYGSAVLRTIIGLCANSWNTILTCKTEAIYPWGNKFPIFLPSQPLATITLRPVFVNLNILDISSRWNHIILVFWLAYFQLA